MARAAHSVRTAPSGDAAGGRYHRVRHSRDNRGTATATEAGVRAAAAGTPVSDATASAKRGAGAGGSTRGSRAGAGAGTRAAAARASPPRCAYLEYTGPQPADGPSPDPYIPFNQPVVRGRARYAGCFAAAVLLVTRGGGLWCEVGRGRIIAVATRRQMGQSGPDGRSPLAPACLPHTPCSSP